MKEINLEEILDKIYDDNYRASYKTWYSKQCIIEAMKEACKQALELAAENANMIGETQHNNGAKDVYSNFVYVVDDNGPDYGYIINKQSILDTINKIK